MGHQHHHPKGPDSAVHGSIRSGERLRLAWVLVLTGGTMGVELVAGYVTGSLALLSDGFHMLTHFMAVALCLTAILVALRPAAPEKTYRNWRLEVLVSLLNGLLLLPIAVYILYEAWQRLLHPATHLNVVPVLIVAVGGLAVNLVSAAFLHRHSKEDLNIRGAFLHMLADSLSSVGVLAAIAVIWIGGPRYYAADPIMAGLISLMILVWSASLVRDALRILLEAIPTHLSLADVEEAMRSLEPVQGVHDLHIWTITSKMHALTAHVALKRDLTVSETERLGHELRVLLDARFDINHVTLQYEVTAAEEKHCDREA